MIQILGYSIAGVGLRFDVGDGTGVLVAIVNVAGPPGDGRSCIVGLGEGTAAVGDSVHAVPAMTGRKSKHISTALGTIREGL